MPEPDPIPPPPADTPEPPAPSPPEEPTPMLDVHPAPHAAHSWREFFIHIATIVLGLCIAVGLEQTVEYFHHRHQLHPLQEALQKSGEANADYMKDNIAMVQSVMDWAMGQAAALEHAGPTGALTLRRMPVAELYAPDTGVWLAAKANGQAGLLSAAEQNWLEDLDVLERARYMSPTPALSVNSRPRMPLWISPSSVMQPRLLPAISTSPRSIQPNAPPSSSASVPSSSKPVESCRTW